MILMSFMVFCAISWLSCELVIIVMVLVDRVVVLSWEVMIFFRKKLVEMVLFIRDLVFVFCVVMLLLRSLLSICRVSIGFVYLR